MVWKNPFAATPRAIAPAGHAIRQLGAPQQQQQAQAEPLSDDPQAKSLIGSAIDTGLGGISAAANILDIPGSAVRDILALENPFDQLLPWNWTSGQGRTSGRDLLEKWGALGKNKPGLDFGDVVAFGAEVGLDPLSYVGIGALTKAGKAAAAAGSLGRASTAAAKRLGKNVDEVGRRYAERSTTLRESLKEYGTVPSRKDAGLDSHLGKDSDFEELSRVKQYARKKKITGDDFQDLLDQPLASKVRLKLPFAEREKLFGARGNVMDEAALASETFTTPMDRVAQSASRHPLSRAVMKEFSAAVGGKITARNQQLHRALYQARRKSESDLRLDVVDAAEKLENAGMLGKNVSWDMRDILEGIVDESGLEKEYKDAIMPSIEKFKEINERLYGEIKELGSLDPEFKDLIEHFPRRKGKVAADRGERHRHHFLKGFTKGTRQVEEIITSKELASKINAISKNFGKGKDAAKAREKAELKLIERYIKKNYGPQGARGNRQAVTEAAEGVVDLEPLMDADGQIIETTEDYYRRVATEDHVFFSGDKGKPGRLYRGISRAELKDIQRRGRIKSRGKMNIGEGQEDTTSFTTSPSQAMNYVTSFAAWGHKLLPRRPQFIIEIEHTGEGAIKMPGGSRTERSLAEEIPGDKITRVFEISSPRENATFPELKIRQTEIEHAGVDPGLTTPTPTYEEKYLDYHEEKKGYEFEPITDDAGEGSKFLNKNEINHFMDVNAENLPRGISIKDGRLIIDKDFPLKKSDFTEAHAWKIDGEKYRPVVKDRAKELAKWIQKNPEHRHGGADEGLFTIHVINDHFRGANSLINRKLRLEMDYEFLKQNLSEPVTDAIERDGITVGEAFTKMGVNHKVAATKLNSMVDEKFTDGIKNQKIDKNEFDDWFADIEKADPGKENWLKNTWVSYTNLFKGGVLSHPARLSRDYISAYARLAEQGMFSLRFAKDAQSIALGKGSKLAAEIPQIKEMLKARGITDASEEEAMENATRMIRLLFGGLGPGKHNIRSDIAELGVHDSQRRFGRDVQDILDAMPRKDPTTRREQAWDVLRMMTGRTKETSLNPLETRGVGSTKAAEGTKQRWLSGSPRTTTRFGPFAAADKVGRWTDSEPRLAAFMKLMMDGYSPEMAMRKIEDALVNYDPSTFTPREHTLKTIFPFYSFTSRQMKFVGSHLMEKPGGVMAQTLRATNEMRDDSFPTPAAIRDTMAIPWGTLPDGSQRYLAGLGLMHEGVLGLTPTLHEGVMGSGGEFLRGFGSQLHPLIKGGVELGTGQSLFRGTDLEDLDPTIGRTMRNVQQLARNPAAAIVGGETERMPPVGSTRALDFVLGHSPLSRVLSSARTATDPRKDALTKILNLTSGLRFHDASIPAQEGVMRDAITDLMRDRGAREFARPYFSEMKKEAMSEEQLKEAEFLQGLMKKLDRRQRARKKTKGE